MRAFSLGLCIALVLLVVANPLVGKDGNPRHAEAIQSPIPLLAHYYIWFDPSSWNRAKQDLPMLGRYSSDDTSIIRQHVIWAKQAGIKGFIVGWKRDPSLDRRLERLVQVAEAEDFKLALTYQALDFQRNPLPSEKVASDLEFFASEFGSRPPFVIFDKPLIIWSGTPRFERNEIDSVVHGLASRLLILSSEKNVAGYQRIADLVDGNLYYWSSADPANGRTYQTRLVEFGREVRANGGLWIAPAAPGFDARLVGGSRVVERKTGETLRRSVEGALNSSPDAVGLISWNEFSENTHLEPSQNFGALYLKVIAESQNASPPSIEMDSSEQGRSGRPYGLAALAGLAVLIIASLCVIARRARRSRGQSLS